MNMNMNMNMMPMQMMPPVRIPDMLLNDFSVIV